MSQPDRSDRRDRWIVAVVLGATAVIFLLVSWSRMTAPFGDSDEGINGSVWAYSSRSLRELGPIESTMGGRLLDGTAYATHPPLIVVETALAESIGGEHEVVSRAPAWLGALASIPLLFVLLRRARFRPVVAAFGTSAACLTSMFWVYGPMLDTPVTSLPFGIAALILWQDAWFGERRVNPWLIAAVATVCAVAGWQSMLLIAVCGLSLALHQRTEPRRAVRSLAPWLAGGITGLVLSVGWSVWTHGGIDVLRDKFTRRAGSDAVSYLDVLDFQLPWIVELLGLSALGLIGCILAVRTRRQRPIALMSLGIVFGYALLFKEAAAGHQYWLYWELLCVAVGMSWFAGRIDTKLRSQTKSAAAVPAALLVALGLIGAASLMRTSTAERFIVDGVQVVDLVRAVPGTDDLAYVGQEFRPRSYVTYYGSRDSEHIGSESELDEVVATDPDRQVLVLTSCSTKDADWRFCERVTEAVGRSSPTVLTASALREALHRSP